MRVIAVMKMKWKGFFFFLQQRGSEKSKNFLLLLKQCSPLLGKEINPWTCFWLTGFQQHGMDSSKVCDTSWTQPKWTQSSKSHTASWPSLWNLSLHMQLLYCLSLYCEKSVFTCIGRKRYNIQLHSECQWHHLVIWLFFAGSRRIEVLPPSHRFIRALSS